MCRYTKSRFVILELISLSPIIYGIKISNIRCIVSAILEICDWYYTAFCIFGTWKLDTKFGNIYQHRSIFKTMIKSMLDSITAPKRLHFTRPNYTTQIWRWWQIQKDPEIWTQHWHTMKSYVHLHYTTAYLV